MREGHESYELQYSTRCKAFCYTSFSWMLWIVSRRLRWMTGCVAVDAGGDQPSNEASRISAVSAGSKHSGVKRDLHGFHTLGTDSNGIS